VLYVVIRGEPFHRITEFGARLLPITVMVPAVFSVNEIGVTSVMTGPDGETRVSVAAADVPPPGEGVETVMAALPADA